MMIIKLSILSVSKNNILLLELQKIERYTLKKKIGLIEKGKKKGKIVIPLVYKGSKLTAKVSHLKVKLLDGKEYFSVFCYLGNASKPMTLLKNRPIVSKEDAISVVLNYASRWKIEEQFTFKKNGFNFEDFRVRSLSRINNLILCLDAAITLMSIFIETDTEI